MATSDRLAIHFNSLRFAAGALLCEGDYRHRESGCRLRISSEHNRLEPNRIFEEWNFETLEELNGGLKERMELEKERERRIELWITMKHFGVDSSPF